MNITKSQLLDSIASDLALLMTEGFSPWIHDEVPYLLLAFDIAEDSPYRSHYGDEITDAKNLPAHLRAAGERIVAVYEQLVDKDQRCLLEEKLCGTPNNFCGFRITDGGES